MTDFVQKLSKLYESATYNRSKPIEERKEWLLNQLKPLFGIGDSEPKIKQKSRRVTCSLCSKVFVISGYAKLFSHVAGIKYNDQCVDGCMQMATAPLIFQDFQKEVLAFVQDSNESFKKRKLAESSSSSQQSSKISSENTQTTLSIRRKYSHMDYSTTFPFISTNSFLNVNSTSTTMSYTIAGIPYDGACTNRPGARFGPKAIRSASHMLCDGIHPYFNNTPIGHLSDIGDLIFPHTNLVEMRKVVEVEVAKLLANWNHFVWLGGDHSITLSILRAYRAHYGTRLFHTVPPIHLALTVSTFPLRK